MLRRHAPPTPVVLPLAGQARLRVTPTEKGTEATKMWGGGGLVAMDDRS